MFCYIVLMIYSGLFSTRVSAAVDRHAWRWCSAHAKYTISHHMV